MSWEFAPNFDAAFRAAIESGNNLIYVCPPAWWTTLPLFEKFPETSASGIRNIVLIPDAIGLRESVALLESVENCRPIHAATGLTRTGRLLQNGQVSTLVATPAEHRPQSAPRYPRHHSAPPGMRSQTSYGPPTH